MPFSSPFQHLIKAKHFICFPPNINFSKQEGNPGQGKFISFAEGSLIPKMMLPVCFHLSLLNYSFNSQIN